MRPAQKRGRSRSARPVKRFKAQALSSVPAVLRLRAPERKVVDVAFNSNFDSAGIFTLLNAPIAGANVYNRVGRKIALQSIMLRGLINWFQAGSAPAADFCRCIILYDRQPNGAAPALSDVLQTVDNAGSTATSALSSLNINNADRFKVIKEWVWPICMPATGTTPQNAEVLSVGNDKAFKAFIKLRGMETHYNAGSAGTIADITTGSLYCLTVGLNSSANTQFRISASARLRYTDL